MTVRFAMESSLVRDGLSVRGGMVIIHQRTPGKDDIMVPASQLTHVSANKPLIRLPWPKARGSLTLRVGSKKYVLRRIPVDQLDEAVAALQDAMA